MDSLSSMVNINYTALYPKSKCTVDNPNLTIPFPLICGEFGRYVGNTSSGIIALTNYRLFVCGNNIASVNLYTTLAPNSLGFCSVPLGMIDVVEVRELFYLYVSCKDGRTVRCTFPTNEQCLEWHRRLCSVTMLPTKTDDLFAYAYFAYCLIEAPTWHQDLCKYTHRPDFRKDVERLGFDLNKTWRISDINKDHTLCDSYPREILVPKAIKDEDLKRVAHFRSSRRIPAVVWRHPSTGCVIVRSSQPEVGWLGWWRSPEDENLLLEISRACSTNSRCSTVRKTTPVATHPVSVACAENNIHTKEMVSNSNIKTDGRFSELDVWKYSAHPSGEVCCMSDSAITCNTESKQTIVETEAISDAPTSSSALPKLLILDARSYAAALGNRTKGGGFEYAEYYLNCEIQFMNLANIHTIRQSFQSLRALCSNFSEQSNWLSRVESTKWLHHISGLLRSALAAVRAVHVEARPVLIHCSDGWDRTPQIVALAEILLDPYYRTLEGFEVLVKREWLDFGHKFGDRCGHWVKCDDPNERCPVFLQWLDCVYQLMQQYPTSFQFNQNLLVKLAHHVYSRLFGTFLFNSQHEQEQHNVAQRTHSFWAFVQVNKSKFRNYLYKNGDQVLQPSELIRDLRVWSAVYLQNPNSAATSPALAATHSPPLPVRVVPEGKGMSESCIVTGLVKTRSCENLLAEAMTTSTPSSPLIEPKQRVQPATPGRQRRNSDSAVISPESSVVLSGPLPLSADSLIPKDALPSEVCVDDTGGGNICDKGGGDINTLAIVHKVLQSEADKCIHDKQIDTSTDTLIGDTSSDTQETTPFSRRAVLSSCDRVLETQINDPPVPFDCDKAVTRYSPDGAVGCSSVARCASSASTGNELSDLSQRGYYEVKSADNGCGKNSFMNLHTSLRCSSQRLVANEQSGLDALRNLCCSTNQALVFQSGTTHQCLPFSVSANQTTSSSTMSTPFHSRTPSSGFPATPCEESLQDYYTLGDIQPCDTNSGASTASDGMARTIECSLDQHDGLPVIRDETQMQLQELHRFISKQSEEMEAMRLKIVRYERHMQENVMCRNCGRVHGADHNDETLSNGSGGSLEHSLLNGGPNSAGETQSNASDMSWEQVDEKETRPTLWVPDHAVYKCVGCESYFNLITRKHHCRSCGQVFCSSCCSQLCAVPQEQLYQPVRVCKQCYSNEMARKVGKKLPISAEGEKPDEPLLTIDELRAETHA